MFAKSLTLQCTFQSWVSFGPHGRQQNSVTDFILDVWYRERKRPTSCHVTSGVELRLGPKACDSVQSSLQPAS